MVEEKQRIDFIDFVKGWVIFLVVWVHTSHPSWVTANFVNSFFFFTSGFFFKKNDIILFSKKQVNGLLIPFIFFYVISYPFRTIVHFWDYRTLETFDWLCIFDIFDCVGRSDYLFVNVPLWFILCIFIVRYYYWFICNLNKILLVFLSVILLLNRSFIDSVSTPFMINNAFYWLGFFILGNLCGKKLINALVNIRYRMIILFVTGVISVSFFYIEKYINNVQILNAFVHFERLSIILFTISVFSFFNGKSFMRPFKYLGENTLQILGYHILILIPLGRIAFKLTNEHDPYIGLVSSLLTICVLYFIISFSNKYIPRLVGKVK